MTDGAGGSHGPVRPAEGTVDKDERQRLSEAGHQTPGTEPAGGEGDQDYSLPFTLDGLTKFAIVGLFVIASVAALHSAKTFLMPVVLAFLFALTFSPVVRFFVRLGVPAPLTALGIVLVLFSTVPVASYMLSGPVTTWIDRAPFLINEVSVKLESLDLPFETLMDLSRRMEEATQGDTRPGLERVVVQTSSFLETIAAGFAATGATIAITMVLLFFLLASGTHFYEKLVQSFSSMSEKKKALTIVYHVERDVSRYLFTITLINAGLGGAMAGAMYLLGMPNPLLWGVAAMVFNFVPYIGAVFGIALSALVALITYDTLGEIAMVPLVYAVLTAIEGQIVTPLFVGRRLEINAVFVFLCVGFWAWLWGIIGALIAVPVLVVVKTIADHSEERNAISHFLSASTRS
jgi:predicted PurR-regulated permease PerM